MMLEINQVMTESDVDEANIVKTWLMQMTTRTLI